MRTLTIALIAAFVFLLSQQLTSADDRHGREERGGSQAVVSGALKCFAQDRTVVGIEIGAGLGILGLPLRGDNPNFAVFADASQAGDCSDLIPALVERVPRICETGSALVAGDDLEVFFVCTGRADVVIAAVGQMAKAVVRLGQP